MPVVCQIALGDSAGSLRPLGFDSELPFHMICRLHNLFTLGGCRQGCGLLLRKPGANKCNPHDWVGKRRQGPVGRLDALCYCAMQLGGSMSPAFDKLGRCLQLAIHNFERAERADSPALQARFRQIAGMYRHGVRNFKQLGVCSPLNAPQAIPEAVAAPRSGCSPTPRLRALSSIPPQP